MSHDTDLVVAISQNKTKDLEMICTLVYEAETQDQCTATFADLPRQAMQIGVPDLAVEHHECKPKTITEQAGLGCSVRGWGGWGLAGLHSLRAERFEGLNLGIGC